MSANGRLFTIDMQTGGDPRKSYNGVYSAKDLTPRVPVVFWSIIEDMDQYDEVRYTGVNSKTIMTIKRIK